MNFRDSASCFRAKIAARERFARLRSFGRGRLSAALAVACAATFPTRADVRPNSLFADNCVLQRDRACPIWGEAREGERVTVEFAGQRVSTIATNGQWRVVLKPMPAEAAPRTLTITGDNMVVLRNVAVGDVWVASGQSNMERQLGPRIRQQDIPHWQAEAAAADYPDIREYAVPEHFALAPMADANGKWAVCSPQTVTNFCAVGYFFARDVYKTERVPIGILFAAVGGTPAESWVSGDSLAAMADFKEDVALMRQSGSGANAPWTRHPNNGFIDVTVLHNAMIAPLQSHPIKGVIWYQGENNNDRAGQYGQLLPLLIADWRRNWNCGEFPFLFVQIAPHRQMTPELREAQLLALRRSPNTAMAVVVDAGDAEDIHPARKETPGQRLALAARALAYGELMEYSGPLFDSMRLEGGKAVLSFTHIGSGLVAKGEALRGFTISADGQSFISAQAEIAGTNVIVWNESVAAPAAVRDGWANVPDVNLFNREGLPASPFRTDGPTP